MRVNSSLVAAAGFVASALALSRIGAAADILAVALIMWSVVQRGRPFVSARADLWIYVLVTCVWAARGLVQLGGDAGTLIHWLVLVPLVVLPSVGQWRPESTAAAVTMLALAECLWFAGALLVDPSTMFFTDGELWRLELFFREPSYLALANGSVLLLAADNRGVRIPRWAAAVCLVGCLLTLSGVGLLLLSAAAAVRVASEPSAKRRMVSVVAFLAVGAAALLGGGFRLVERKLSLASETGRLDRSTALRLTVPVLAAVQIVDKQPYGVGLASVEPYIEERYEEFLYLLKYSEYGEPTLNTNLDNIYAYILASGGVLLLLLHVGVAIRSARFARPGRGAALAFVIVPLLCGFYVSAFYWILFRVLASGAGAEGTSRRSLAEEPRS